MCKTYAEIAKTIFQKTTIIIDKHHFIRQATWVIENVRKRRQRGISITLCKHYKQSWSLILTRYRKSKDKNKRACDLMLQYGLKDGPREGLSKTKY